MSDASGFLTRPHGFERSPGTTLTAGHCSCREIWRHFPFSSCSGQLTEPSHFPWLLTVQGGGGGYRSATFSFNLWTDWLLTVQGGGGLNDRLLFLQSLDRLFEHPEGGGG